MSGKRGKVKARDGYRIDRRRNLVTSEEDRGEGVSRRA